MKTTHARNLATFVSLVTLAGFQDVTPALWGAKVPLLLFFGAHVRLGWAIAAALVQDALGGVPLGVSLPIFLLQKLLPPEALPLTAFLAQLWFSVWGCRGGAAAPFAAVLMAIGLVVVGRFLLPALARITGLEELGTRMPQ